MIHSNIKSKTVKTKMFSHKSMMFPLNTMHRPNYPIPTAGINTNECNQKGKLSLLFLHNGYYMHVVILASLWFAFGYTDRHLHGSKITII